MKYAECKKCGSLIQYEEEDTYWDESGYMYSTKLVDCNKCHTPNVIKYEDDVWLQEYSRTFKNISYRRKND